MLESHASGTTPILFRSSFPGHPPKIHPSQPNANCQMRTDTLLSTSPVLWMQVRMLVNQVKIIWLEVIRMRCPLLHLVLSYVSVKNAINLARRLADYFLMVAS